MAPFQFLLTLLYYRLFSNTRWDKFKKSIFAFVIVRKQTFR